ncbi:6081_t:CDS:10 [Diversispora eburnea]|uniref:acylaminoacyl-peptidase n=1 Tax=Diversispora eburnea TaxID=1213867 RepID=A0A9N8YLZ3_9GLOM|nr:6081_t:CDS:10 [Diversispora eburnea]
MSSPFENSSNKDKNKDPESIAVNTFKSLAKIPSYSSAQILPTSSTSLLLIETGLSQRDFTRNIKRKVTKQLVVSIQKKDDVENKDDKPTIISTSSLPIDLGDVVLKKHSPSGKRLISLRAVSDNKRFIWEKGNLVHILDVTDTHGDFYSDVGQKFDYNPSWGERLANKCIPVIIHVEVAGKIIVLPEFDNIDPGQIILGPEDKTLIFTGYNKEPRQFGLAACINRLAGIYQCDLDGCNLVIPIVRSPSESFNQNFPGLYNDRISSNSFVVIDGNEFLLMHSYWRSRRTILALNLTTGRDGCGGDEIIQNLTLTGSWTLLNVWKNYVIAIQGFPNKFYQLNLGVITGLNNEKGLKINWTVIDQPNVVEDVSNILSKSTWSIIQPFEDKPNLEIILHQPNNIGFGQDYVESLIGKIGHLEIEEVQTTVKYFVEKNYADPNAIALIGGSHGGFISGHLVGKFPDFYKACILNNPVLNIGAMSSVTDIPDWCFSELGLPYDLTRPSIVKPSDYTKMYENSPIANIDKVKTPILLQLGQNDKRVPHIDGLQWWYYLKGQQQSKGKDDQFEIRCKMYSETGHSLDSIEAEVGINSDCLKEIFAYLAESAKPDNRNSSLLYFNKSTRKRIAGPACKKTKEEWKQEEN